MPPVYILFHLLLSALVAAVTLRLARQPKAWALQLGAVAAGVLALADGLVAERQPERSVLVGAFHFHDAVFVTDLWLEAMVAVLAALWHRARATGDTALLRRGRWLAPAGLAVALFSYAWYFMPPPVGLSSVVDETGVCRQSSEESCSAAAAVTLLHHYGIRTDEAEMGRLCLTRERFGTPTLGLYRGLAVKGAGRGLRPRFVELGRVGGAEAVRRLATLGRPAILSVGLDLDTPDSVVARLRKFGWRKGVRHSVVLLDADRAAERLDIADPSYGRERWPAQDLEWIWDGRALVLK